MEPSEFLKALANELGQEFLAVSRFKRFVHNSDVVGAHAEACVRQYVERLINPLRMSTGAVISPELCADPKSIPQLDGIIWFPRESPALFDHAGFALVPRGACRGVLEIKRSMYQGSGQRLQELLDRVDDFFPSEGNVYQEGGRMRPRMLGVFCLHGDRADPLASKFVEDGSAIVLVNDQGGSFEPNHSGIITLTNYLTAVRNSTLCAETTRVFQMNASALPSELQ